MKLQLMITSIGSLLTSMSLIATPSDVKVSVMPSRELSSLPASSDPAELQEFKDKSEGRNVLVFDFGDNSLDAVVVVDSSATLIAGSGNEAYALQFNHKGVVQSISFLIKDLNNAEGPDAQAIYGLEFISAAQTRESIPLSLVQAIGSFDAEQGALSLYRNIIGSGDSYNVLYSLPAGPAYFPLDALNK